jgi:hypothetical protein
MYGKLCKRGKTRVPHSAETGNVVTCVCIFGCRAESKEQNKKKLIGYLFFLFWLFSPPGDMEIIQ